MFPLLQVSELFFSHSNNVRGELWYSYTTNKLREPSSVQYHCPHTAHVNKTVLTKKKKKKKKRI